jgi:LmbE family N-acetylglucosaminyl deacetylase
MNYLIIAAHPDDEVLGAGAMMDRLSFGEVSVRESSSSGD